MARFLKLSRLIKCNSRGMYFSVSSSFKGTSASASFNTSTICRLLNRFLSMALLLFRFYAWRSYVLAGLNFWGRLVKIALRLECGTSDPRLWLAPEAYRQICRELLERDGWRCRSCRRMEDLQVHHIQLRSHQGDDIESNLITLCTNRHQRMHRR